MARRRPAGRLDQIRTAALRVFAARGLRRARMTDVARELGVSPGTLYQYFESKGALFHWVIGGGGGEAATPEPARLPVRAPAPAEAERRLREQLAAGFHLPALAAALARRRTADARAELEGVVRELYDQIARTRGPATVMERSAIDLPELYELYFVEQRRAFFARLTRYLERRMAEGQLRRAAEPWVATRFLAEAVVYFARHRHGDLDPSLFGDEEAAREGVVALLVASLVPDAPRTPEDR